MEMRNVACMASSKADTLGQDFLYNIMGRLPAKSLAAAACVCRTWCMVARALNLQPRFFSALSLLPDLQVAMDIVMHEILDSPFRPDFAVVFVGQKFSLSEASKLSKAWLGRNVPVIGCHASGIFGTDVETNGQQEVNWLQPLVDANRVERQKILAKQHGLLVCIGRFPGVQVKAIALHNSHSVEDVNRFVAEAGYLTIKESSSMSPMAMILLADPRANEELVFNNLDDKFSRETIIAGGFGAHTEQGCLFVNDPFDCHGSNIQVACHEVGTSSSGGRRKSKQSALELSGNEQLDIIALVFSKSGQTSPSSSYNTAPLENTKGVSFHAAPASGLVPVGPVYRVVAVKKSRDLESDGTFTWLTCLRENLDEELDGAAVLEDLAEQAAVEVLNRCLFIGVCHNKKKSTRSKGRVLASSFSLHSVQGADEEYLYVDGGGIRTADIFQFYMTDQGAAREANMSQLQNFADALKNSQQSLHSMTLCNHCEVSEVALQSGHGNKILGAIVFTCIGRDETFFDTSNVDSSCFKQIFPGVPLGGIFCNGEIGPPAVFPSGALKNQGIIHKQTEINYFSSIFLIFFA